MSYTSPEVKIRTLALRNAQLQADLGGVTSDTFRWYNTQLKQNEIAKAVVPGTCVRLMRVSTLREMNQGGIMNLSWLRFQIEVLDLDSETARSVANDVIAFLGTVDLCSNNEFGSPLLSPRQNPCRLLNQIQTVITNPQSPAGPVWGQLLDVRIPNREDLYIS